MGALAEKQAMVSEVQQKFSQANSVILADYRGLNVQEVTELRRKLREAGVEYKVIKNTLTSRAAKAANIEGLDEHLAGPTALAFSYEDPAVPAKVLADFAKDHKKLELKAGVLEGKVINIDSVKALANLPSREVLLAKTVGLFQAPLRNMAGVLAGPLRKFVYAVDAVRKQQAGE